MFKNLPIDNSCFFVNPSNENHISIFLFLVIIVGSCMLGNFSFIFFKKVLSIFFFPETHKATPFFYQI